MNRPKMFLRLSDHNLEQALLQSPLSRSFLLARSQEGENWVSQMALEGSALALVDANDFSESDMEALLAQRKHTTTEFVFFSNGRPNVLLDEFMHQGVGYHLRAPFDFCVVEQILKDYLEGTATPHPDGDKVVSSPLNQFGRLLGSSVVMTNLFRRLKKVSSSDANILIIGESGSGKELVANTIHAFGNRSAGPFVALNCGALSPELVDSELFGHVRGAFTGASREHMGVFQRAHGGTLFLDEVTEMPLEHQVRLLRVIEQNEFIPVGGQEPCTTDVRILAATNRDPVEAVKQGYLREDLYFRLAQVPVEVPPLRERQQDITGLARHFLAYRNALDNKAKSITPEALDLIQHYSWPGNVRELKHAIDLAFILADNKIAAQNLPVDILASAGHNAARHSVPFGVPLSEIEEAAILGTLHSNNGNKTDTASQLGISVKTLYNKLDKYEQFQ